MTMWTGIVLIVFISVSFSYLTKRARYQMGDARITDRLGKQDMIIKELQERIANLEAIVIEEEAPPVQGALIRQAGRQTNQPRAARVCRPRSHPLASAWQKRNSQQDQSPAIFRLNDRQAGPFPAPS
jgi:hypothetical protein